MSFAYSLTGLRRTLCALLLVSASAVAHAEPPAAPPPPPKLRIKNAQSIRVSLGARRHEPAAGIRPEKGVWNVVPVTDLAGASAEMVDLTPNAPRSRWTLAVQGEKLVLDARRFLPTHVYQLDLRKEKRLVGSALVYLYPPPADGVGRVDFKDDETGKKDQSQDVTSVPKGDL
jgi:hypothetical protein